VLVDSLNANGDFVKILLTLGFCVFFPATKMMIVDIKEGSRARNVSGKVWSTILDFLNIVHQGLVMIPTCHFFPLSEAMDSTIVNLFHSWGAVHGLEREITPEDRNRLIQQAIEAMERLSEEERAELTGGGTSQ
jgi:hypothetical protein